MAKSTKIQNLNAIGKKTNPSTASMHGLQQDKANTMLAQGPSVAAPSEKARYIFCLTLLTETPLHIGTGQDRPLSERESNGAAPDERPFCADITRDCNNNPFIPGASLKGILLRQAKAKLDDAHWKHIFGYPEMDSTRPGHAEFYGLSATAGSHSTETHTRIALDRATRTVKDGMLLNEDSVAPQTPFTGKLVLQLSDAAQAQALYALLGAGHAIDLQLGAHGRMGWGRVKLQVSSAHVFGPEQMRQWLAQNLDPQGQAQGWESASARVDLSAPNGVTVLQRQTTPAHNSIDLTLAFEGPFAVRDPRKDKTPGDTNTNTPNTRPKATANNRPYLPGTSLLGALRSQAERIVRTLGGKVPDFHHSTQGNTTPTDPVSLLFGCAGWRGLLGIGNEFVGNPDTQTLDQDMIALCRVTGGGKDHAKFKMRAWVDAALKGSLRLDTQRLERLPVGDQHSALGLLYLTLQDLSLGHITLGMAASKGWGWVKPFEWAFTQTWNDFAQKQGADQKIIVQQLNRWCAQDPAEATAPRDLAHAQNNASRPSQQTASNSIPALRKQLGSQEEFHNPYHFLPFARLHGRSPDSDLSLPKQAQALGHGHDRYQTNRHSGSLTVELCNETPLFIGATRDDPTGKTSPVTVRPFIYNNSPAIPGTSLRGMLSGVLEPMSGSALRVLNDEVMVSVRMAARNNEYLPFQGVVKQGEDEDGNACFVVQQTHPKEKKGALCSISKEAMDMLYALADERWRAKGSKLDMSSPRLNLYVPKDQRFNKRGEPEATQKGQIDLLPAIDWADDIPQAQRLRNDNPEKWGTRARLMPGQVVYFKGDTQHFDDGEEQLHITEIAWSALYRRGHWSSSPTDPGPLNLRRWIAADEPNRLPLGLRQDNSLQAAEYLLGAVGLAPDGSEKDVNGLAFAAKIAVGMACPRPNNGQPVQFGAAIHLKELASPKPPSPNMYAQPKNGAPQYIRKVALVQSPAKYQAQGTKTYLHAWGLGQADGVKKLNAHGLSQNPKDADVKLPWESQKTSQPPSAQDKDYTLSPRQVRVTPVPPLSRFQFTIRFVNLSDAELQLLCASLQPSPNFRHKLGMGRPIGMGSVKLETKQMTLHNKQATYETGTPHQQIVPTEHLLQKATLGMATLAQQDSAVHDALLLLGEPQNVQKPVHYPQVNNARIEDRNYRWWTENEKKILSDRNTKTEGMYLAPIVNHNPTLR